jgi:hypothetical protein
LRPLESGNVFFVETNSTLPLLYGRNIEVLPLSSSSEIFLSEEEICQQIKLPHFTVLRRLKHHMTKMSDHSYVPLTPFRPDGCQIDPLTEFLKVLTVSLYEQI